MSRNKMRKLPGASGTIQRGKKKRGMGTVQRSESGGAVKGPIPKPGGTNKMSYMKEKQEKPTTSKSGGGGGY